MAMEVVVVPVRVDKRYYLGLFPENREDAPAFALVETIANDYTIKAVAEAMGYGEVVHIERKHPRIR